MSAAVEAAILELLDKLPPGKSVSPEDVARAVDSAGWRRELGKVRAVAVGLARAGRIVILRHNKPADPETFKGVWRMRLPLPDDGANS
ncbi:MAG: DUF3253 domain-containing protein [Phenylobacterium sp.]|uniref:DUF3253 domain-containing protein n=1 Tax=Phenylobacterium sp. TaxID=1871053 RepID=UPI001A5FD2F7|nr:DUF3253 domain-containing protein [Phenylobacterium sp.]MBL8773975.1 DUF3253 domain-containing protein [Phenylobacterium sp.]